MVLAGDVLFVAGAPAYFPDDDTGEKYEAAHRGKLGGVLWAASASDGGKLAQYRLGSTVVFDGSG